MANGFEISQFVGNLMSIWLQPQNILDIAIVAFVIYELLAVIRKTRAAQLAKGAVVVVAVYALAYILGLRTVMWVMNSVLQVGILALVVLFQPELRRALEQMAAQTSGRPSCCAAVGWIRACGPSGRMPAWPSATRRSNCPTQTPAR